MKTLTPIGINKQLVRLRDSLDYATFLEAGKLRKVSVFKADVTDNKIKIYVYLDDTVTGAVKDSPSLIRTGMSSRLQNASSQNRARKAFTPCSLTRSSKWKTRMRRS